MIIFEGLICFSIIEDTKVHYVPLQLLPNYYEYSRNVCSTNLTYGLMENIDLILLQSIEQGLEYGTVTQHSEY